MFSEGLYVKAGLCEKELIGIKPLPNNKTVDLFFQFQGCYRKQHLFKCAYIVEIFVPKVTWKYCGKMKKKLAGFHCFLISPQFLNCLFSSPEHNMLSVSYCDRSMSGIRPSVCPSVCEQLLKKSSPLKPANRFQ